MSSHFTPSFIKAFKNVCVCSLYREPVTLKDAIGVLQKACGIVIPKSDDEWEGIPRMSIDVRREYVFTDGLREARKSRFDPAKLLKVYDHLIV